MALPFDILLVIASTSTTTWWQMISAIKALRDFSYTLEGQQYVSQTFGNQITEKYYYVMFDDIIKIKTFFGRQLHSFFGDSAVFESVYDRTTYEAWYYRGKLHRDGDLPAIVRSDGSKDYYRFGERYELQ